MSDCDFARYKVTSNSTSGYIALLHCGAIAYYSGRQTIVAACTAVAENTALAKLVVKIKDLRVYGCMIWSFVRHKKLTLAATLSG